MDAVKVKVRQRTQQWFGADEPNSSVDAAKVADAKRVTLALDADAHPDVRWPVEPRAELRQPLRSLRQDLVRVLWSVGHDVEDLSDVVDRHVRVTEVAH